MFGLGKGKELEREKASDHKTMEAVIHTQHPAPTTLCCESMQAALEMRCTTHDDPFDCPDSLIAYNEGFDQFGLIVHDGARSVVLIRHCPWCGQRLGSAPNEESEDRS